MEGLRSPAPIKHIPKATASVLHGFGGNKRRTGKKIYNDNLHNISSFSFVRATYS
jgi:hypothetical protein